jgi:hypothetical protein
LSTYVNDNGTAVKVFPLAASGNVAPTRTIAGTNTGIHNITGIALDAQGELYVADGGAGTVAGSIFVFKSGATGNVAPIRTITGTNTQITSPSSIAVDSDGTIYPPLRPEPPVVSFASQRAHRAIAAPSPAYRRSNS